LKLETSTVEKVAVTSRITGKEDKEPVNVKVKATVVKNKIDRPWFSAPIYIRFGEGIDNVRSIIELAVNIGTIKKTGAFFSFAQGEEILFKVQGIEQLWQMLSDDSKMFNKVQSSLVIKEDEKVKEEYKNVVQDIPPDEIDDMLSNVADNFIQKSEAKKKKKEDAAE
jgi:recombination protein RecA